MTSKLKCPFCKEEIISDVCCMFNNKNKDYTTGTQIYKCSKCGLLGNKELVQELTLTRKALEIARKALEEIKKFCDGCRWCDSNLYDPTLSDGRRIAETTNKALETIGKHNE